LRIQNPVSHTLYLYLWIFIVSWNKLWWRLQNSIFKLFCSVHYLIAILIATKGKSITSKRWRRGMQTSTIARFVRVTMRDENNDEREHGFEWEEIGQKWRKRGSQKAKMKKENGRPRGLVWIKGDTTSVCHDNQCSILYFNILKRKITSIHLTIDVIVYSIYKIITEQKITSFLQEPMLYLVISLFCSSNSSFFDVVNLIFN